MVAWVASVAAFVMSAHAQDVARFDRPIPSIVVEGEASRDAPPDMAGVVGPAAGPV